MKRNALRNQTPAFAAAFATAVLLACAPDPLPVAPEGPPPVDITRLNSLHLAEIVTAFGPDGVRCANANRYEAFGPVPDTIGEGPHQAHVGAYGYAIFCTHPDGAYMPESPDLQWFVWVRGADPWQAVVARCFDRAEDHMTNNWCWTPYATTSAQPAVRAPG